MSLEDLQDHVWSRLSVRRHVAGKAVVDRLVRRVVRRWPALLMDESTIGNQAIVMEGMTLSVERGERANVQMGVFLTLIISTLITEIVKAVWAWWRSSASNRVQLAQYQQEILQR
jgi:hypothetical protein